MLPLLYSKRVQRALREKDKEAEEATAIPDGWIPVECHRNRF